MRDARNTTRAGLLLLAVLAVAAIGPRGAAAEAGATDPWLAGDQGQAAVAALADHLGDGGAALGVDPGRPDGTALLRYDADHPGAGALLDAVSGLDVGASLHVEPSRLRVDDVARAHDLVARLAEVHGVEAPVLLRYDAASDAMLAVTPLDGPWPDLLRDDLGADVGEVVVVDGAPQRTAGSRTADVPAHWGGALIWNQRTGEACTSGFTTYNVFGVRGSLTAAHCGLANDHWWSSWVPSTPYDFGLGWGNGTYPVQDFQWIHSAGISYTNRIHTSPLSPAWRSVTAAADPSLGASVCASGAATGATCAPIVTSTSATYCDSGGCTGGLDYAVASPWSPVAAAADSGGPVYSPSGSSSAVARGTIVGTAFGNDVFFHKISTIQGAGLTVLTVP